MAGTAAKTIRSDGIGSYLDRGLQVPLIDDGDPREGTGEDSVDQLLERDPDLDLFVQECLAEMREGKPSVLGELWRSGVSLSIGQIAGRMHVHSDLVREDLGKLVEAGVVVVHPETTESPTTYELSSQLTIVLLGRLAYTN